MLLLGFLFMSLLSLVAVAFLTLIERKILSYIQMRVGPNKVGIWGIFQPFSDAFKLFSKEFIMPYKSNFYPFWVSPFVSLLISMFFWFLFPYFYNFTSWSLSLIYILCLFSVSVYPVMVSGWFSNSSYSILGSMRSISQSISYEVNLFFLFLCLMFFSGSLSMIDFNLIQMEVSLIFCCYPVFLMLFVSLLAELNRTPFDFSEGESELVSGFNIEYGGTGFSFIFLAEYLSILFSSIFVSYVFMGMKSESWSLYFMMVMVTFLIIVIRAAFPRYRYDKLMSMCWKSYLGGTLSLLIFYAGAMSF